MDSQNKYRADRESGSLNPQQTQPNSRTSLLGGAWNSAVEFVEESWPVLVPTLGLSAGGAATYFTGNPLFLELGAGGLAAFGIYLAVDTVRAYREGERDLRRGMLRGVGREVRDMRRTRPVEPDILDGMPTARTERVAPEGARGRRSSMNGEEIADSFRSDGAPVDAWIGQGDAANASPLRQRRGATNRDDMVVEDVLSPASVTSPQGADKAAADQVRGRSSSH